MFVKSGGGGGGAGGIGDAGVPYGSELARNQLTEWRADADKCSLTCGTMHLMVMHICAGFCIRNHTLHREGCLVCAARRRLEVLESVCAARHRPPRRLIACIHSVCMTARSAHRQRHAELLLEGASKMKQDQTETIVRLGWAADGVAGCREASRSGVDG